MITDLTYTKIWIGDDSILREKVKARALELGWKIMEEAKFVDNKSFYFYTKDSVICYSAEDNIRGRSGTFNNTSDKREIFAKDFDVDEIINKYQIF